MATQSNIVWGDDKRTRAERRKDDRDSVRSNLQALGAAGALRYSAKQLSDNPPVHVRRMCILTIRAAAKQLRQEINSATRLAACHRSGLRTLGIKVALLLVLATAAQAQERPTKVYTNVIDGRAYRQAIVAVVRLERPAAPVPASLPGTPLPPPKWRPEIGGTGYVPPPRPTAASTASRPAPAPQPWFVNGIYVGPSPNGNWMATSVGRPIVDVNIVGTPRQPERRR